MTKPMTHVFFDPKGLGRKMREISVDVIRTEKQNVTSRWFHAKDADLFIWQDEKSHVIKQQVSFSGLIIEWNVVDGLKTGVLIEEEQDDKQGIPGSEVIRFDATISQNSIQQALQLLSAIEVVEVGLQKILIHNFEHSPSLDTMSSHEIFKNYEYLRGEKIAGFWERLKAIFKKKST
jgi:hypothetical protein